MKGSDNAADQGVCIYLIDDCDRQQLEPGNGAGNRVIVLCSFYRHIDNKGLCFFLFMPITMVEQDQFHIMLV